MFERILAPLDGSPEAAHAIPLVARLARLMGGSVIILQALDTVTEVTKYAAGSLAPYTITSDTEGAQAYLDGVATIIAGEGVSVETETRTGNVGETIVEMAREKKADSIILTSHGRTGILERLLGGVAEHVSRDAPVPILLLRAGEEHALIGADGDGRSVRALLPLDGTAEAESALVPALFLVAALSTPDPGTLHLVRVLAKGQDASAAESYLSALAERLQAATPEGLKLEVTWSTSAAKSVEDELIALADGYDLVALTKPEATGRRALGEIIEKLLGNVKLPLLIVPPDGATDPTLLQP
ncbi:MAG TPA: universal stress protein [Ktedonobacterales bacterium]|jgi:nucleotide-binding universal stress UspA family protein